LRMYFARSGEMRAAEDAEILVVPVKILTEDRLVVRAAVARRE
jgi:hypothetical protein